MSMNTIEDPGVESFDRGREIDREIDVILSPRYAELIAATYGFGPTPEPNPNLRQHAKDELRIRRWIGDREALYGFAANMIEHADNVTFATRSEAVNAAIADHDYELAMKDPTEYYKRIVGGMADFYEARTRNHSGNKRFVFTRTPAYETYEVKRHAVPGGVREVEYDRAKGEELPEAFRITLGLNEGFAYDVVLRLQPGGELEVYKKAGERMVTVDDKKAPAYYQLAASMLYRALCNYDEADDADARDSAAEKIERYSLQELREARR